MPRIVITFICFYITEVKATRWRKKTFKVRGWWLYGYVLQDISKKRQKKTQQRRQKFTSAAVLFRRTLVSKNNDAYAHKYIYMNGMRHCFLYTNIFTIMTGMLAYQRVYMCCICVFKKSGIFPSSYFIMSERVRTQKRGRKMRRIWAKKMTFAGNITTLILTVDRRVNFTTDDRKRWSIHLI